MHPKSYIEMTDCHDFGGKLLNHQSEGEDGCYHEKFRNFVARAEPNKKKAFFRVFMVPFDYPTGNSFTQTNGTNGKPRLKMCLLLLWRVCD